VVEGDRRYLQEARHIYTISKVVGNRLNLYSGLKSKPLFPPLLDTEQYRCEEYGDYFFFPSRITAGKRQHLAIEAMAHLTSSARLVIAGEPETPADLDRLVSAIREHQLESRVEVIPRWISEKEKLRLLAGARGVVYLPFDEDYGYVTLEAFHASKPVLTLTDAGGPLELVEHGRNGLICDDAERLAKAIDELSEDLALAERLGQGALETINEREISWDRVIRCLTQ
jgi:glycosyltransferase involved in cell wall biosynthesis